MIAILLRAHIKLCPKMPLQAAELLAVEQANNVLWRHRLLDGNGRDQFLLGIDDALAAGSDQRRVHRRDEIRQLFRHNGVVRDIGRHDFGSQSK